MFIETIVFAILFVLLIALVWGGAFDRQDMP